MNEVSCKALSMVWPALARKGIPIERVLAGTGLTVQRMHDRNERIDWAQFVAVMKQLRPHFSDPEYVELGREFLRTPSLRFALTIARLLFSAMDFYRWMNKPHNGVGNQIFTCVTPSHRELAPNVIEMELVVAPGFEVCQDFFLVTLGNMEELPKLLGLARSVVTMTPIERGMRYHVVVPAGVPPLARAWRVVTRQVSARDAGRELKAAHEALLDRFVEVDRTKLQVERQAAQLRVAHAVNALVQGTGDLGPTLASIADALVSQGGFASARLELDVDTGERHGGSAGVACDDVIARPLGALGDDTRGSLTVTLAAAADRAQQLAILDLTLPSIGMAIANALHRSRLESRVASRTTELSAARDALTEKVSELHQVQATRARFFGNISHEIRTPLSLILLAATDVEKRMRSALDERSAQALGVVADSARKLTRLVDELLLLAAGQEDKLAAHQEPTDLAALIERIAVAWRPAAEVAGIAFVTRTAPTLMASVDMVAIERIVTNLISNAVKYTPPGGTVELELVRDHAGIRLSVLDTGTGFDPDLRDRLFERFERSSGDDRRKHGSGLGLHLAKQLVEIHGGSLEAIVRPSGGSELRVRLPAGLVLPDRTAPRHREIKLRLADVLVSPPTRLRAGTRVVPPGVSHGVVLLAEDDVRLAEMIAELLGDEYTVVIAHDGEEALRLAAITRPQLLVTDVDMPGIDGVELARRFRRLVDDPLAPIIILSAVLDLTTRLEGLEAGAVDYVTKPFEALELKARVRAQFRTRDLANRLHRAEQLATLSFLTSGLAHELRNPANGITNAVPPLLALLPAELRHPDHPVAQLLDVVAECSGQITFLARQLLGFRSSNAPLEMVAHDVRRLVERARALASGSLATVRLELDLVPATVTCAAPLLTQVLTNLLENAAHAAGQGGWVRLRARRAGGTLALAITDSGPGVPAELRTRVFEPFFTTKPPGLGTGLGLPLARDIVARHGGVLELRDEGAIQAFVIELPDATDPSTCGPGMLAPGEVLR